MILIVEKVVRMIGGGRGTVGYGLRFCHLRFFSPKANLNTKVRYCHPLYLTDGFVVGGRSQLAQTFVAYPPEETP